MCKIFSPVIVTAIAFQLLAYTVPARAHYPIGTDRMLASRNFPLLTCLMADNRVARLLQKDQVLNKIRVARLERLKQALSKCQTVGCSIDSLKWRPAEVVIIGSELVKLYAAHSALQSEITLLSKTGNYDTVDKTNASLLKQGWEKEAKGINYILDVYFTGAKPTYVKIDSISFQKNDDRFANQVRYLLDGLANDKKSRDGLFFTLPLNAAIAALRLNGRDEAARYLPLNAGGNKEPYRKVKTTNWADFPYSVILIPGLGPEALSVALDPGGAKRCEDGAERFRKGMAPFILVSGGHVHPFQTPFNEAVEMKNYLMNKLGIPAAAVFIEPHARHTTTNLRNANRMIYQFGIPANKPVLIVTDSSQTNYMAKGMDKVALRDLGYTPYHELKKLNDKETSYYPNRESLQVNATDPLDPR